MDKFVVAKPFNTKTRRLAVGTTVTLSDLADDVMPIEDRRSRRFIVGEDTRTAERAVEKAEKAEAPILAVAEPDQPALVEEAREERKKR